jgi:hypothetical protein
VWKRYQKIFELYKAPDHLAASKGRGSVTGKPPESTHCNNIGAVHRQEIYPALKRWFDIPIPEKENTVRHKSAELMCWTGEAKGKVPAWKEAAREGEAARRRARRRLAALEGEDALRQLRRDWAKLLGEVEPVGTAKVLGKESEKVGDVTLERMLVQFEEAAPLPMVLLSPARQGEKKSPLVIGVAQQGKAEFLRQRAGDIAELLKAGTAVCLVDVRGTGESKPEGGRGRTTSATSLSATELMLGRTLLGLRLRDLRSVLAWMRHRDGIDGDRVAVWGESFAPVNGADAKLAVPLDAETMPAQAEPLGGLLALLAPLFEDGVRAAYGHGGLSSYQSLLQGPFVYVPHDAVVPGAVTAGDLDLVAEVLGKRVRQEGTIDGLNRAVKQRTDSEPAAKWLLRALAR